MITIDLKNQTLGRAASQVAILLRGKNHPAFRPNVVSGEKVTVLNIDKVRLSGKKVGQKTYKRYSGYPGGLKMIPFKDVFKKNPGFVFRQAVQGMLPKNKLRKALMKNLIVKR